MRLRLTDGRVTDESHYAIQPGDRVRDVRQGPDGMIDLLIDSPRGRIVSPRAAATNPGREARRLRSPGI